MSALTAVRSVVFSPDGNQLASSHRNGKIVVWNAETGKVACAQFKGHQNSVHSIAFSPDGTRIVSGSRDKTVMVWDAVTGSSVLAPLTGHNDCITSVALSPDGKQIISGSKDGVVRFWSAVTGNVILVSHSRTRSAVTSVAFFPDGSWAVAGSSELDFWMWDTKKETWKWNDYPAEAFQEAKAIRSVAITASGKVIVCGSGTNIQVWNSDTGELLESPYPTNDGLINSVAISPDAKLIVSGSHNSSFRVWDVDTGNPVAGKVYVPNRLGTPKDATRKEVYSVALSPKKGCIALGTASDIEVYAYI
jgi:WD40 repeat protein